jgi:hypothetical protein
VVLDIVGVWLLNGKSALRARAGVVVGWHEFLEMLAARKVVVVLDLDKTAFKIQCAVDQVLELTGKSAVVHKFLFNLHGETLGKNERAFGVGQAGYFVCLFHKLCKERGDWVQSLAHTTKIAAVIKFVA